MSKEKLMTPAQVAEYLGLAEGTLQNWRVSRQGPKYVKLGKGRNCKVAYRPADVDAWVMSMTVPLLRRKP